MKFSAAGDAIIQRRIYEGYDFESLREVVMEGDARFFNLETTLNREGECFASQFSGGTYIRTNPEALDDMKKFGFNMTSFNNNHALDFSYKGLEKTLEALDASGLVHAGVGRNIGQASAPAFLDTKGGRVALISINTSFEPSMMAGGVTERTPGRPGVFGIRHNTKVVVKKDALDTLRDIAKEQSSMLRRRWRSRTATSCPSPKTFCILTVRSLSAAKRRVSLPQFTRVT